MPTEPRSVSESLHILVVSCVLIALLTGCHSTQGAPAQPAAEPHSTSSFGPEPDPSSKAASPPAAETPSRKLPMLSAKPLLSARLDIEEQCPHEVFLNGGPVTQNMTLNPAHETYPINHWLRSGKNVLDVMLHKRPGGPDKCNIKLQIQLSEFGADPGVEPGTLFTLVYDGTAAASGDPTGSSTPEGTVDAHRVSGAASGAVWVGPITSRPIPNEGSDVQMLSREFDLTLPFPEWAFLRGDEYPQRWELVRDSKDWPPPLYYKVLDALQSVRGLLAKRDVPAFLDACEERSREIDLAFYKKPGETRASLKKQVEKVMNDPEYELATLTTGEDMMWGFDMGSRGQLIYLTTGQRASTVLRYELKGDTPFSIVLPVMFRSENGKFIVTR